MVITRGQHRFGQSVMGSILEVVATKGYTSAIHQYNLGVFTVPVLEDSNPELSKCSKLAADAIQARSVAGKASRCE